MVRCAVCGVRCVVRCAVWQWCCQLPYQGISILASIRPDEVTKRIIHHTHIHTEVKYMYNSLLLIYSLVYIMLF